MTAAFVNGLRKTLPRSRKMQLVLFTIACDPMRELHAGLSIHLHDCPGHMYPDTPCVHTPVSVGSPVECTAILSGSGRSVCVVLDLHPHVLHVAPRIRYFLGNFSCTVPLYGRVQLCTAGYTDRYSWSVPNHESLHAFVSLSNGYVSEYTAILALLLSFTDLRPRFMA
jgi:hypothetical protein